MGTREIKFRAWEPKKKTWHYFHVPQDIGRVVNGMSFFLDYGHWCEYTGLKDKNGKEIYEGDCLRCIHWEQELSEGDPVKVPDIAVITYDPPTFNWSWFRGGNDLGNDGMNLGDFGMNEYEVIGNIYENPELIGETDGN